MAATAGAAALVAFAEAYQSARQALQPVSKLPQASSAASAVLPSSSIPEQVPAAPVQPEAPSLARQPNPSPALDASFISFAVAHGVAGKASAAAPYPVATISVPQAIPAAAAAHIDPLPLQDSEVAEAPVTGTSDAKPSRDLDVTEAVGAVEAAEPAGDDHSLPAAVLPDGSAALPEFDLATADSPPLAAAVAAAASAAPTFPFPTEIIVTPGTGDRPLESRPVRDQAPATEPLALRRPLIRRVLRILGRIAAVWALLAIVLTLFYRFIDPPITAFMISEALKGRGMDRQWVDIDDISPNLIKAVTMSEDGRYCEHWGVDWAQMQIAFGSGGRGASTITMQTAKNLYLWNSRFLGLGHLRKAIEVPLSLYMSAVLPKRRLLEIYLNIVEWGPGVFGAEAAARHHFKTSAANLSARQAALLAVSLPNPIKRNAGKPSRGLKFYASNVQKRMVGAEAYLGCVFDP